MNRFRAILIAVCLAAVVATAGAATADAKKRKTVTVRPSISLLYVQGSGLDRFSGLVAAPFGRCAQFVKLGLVRETGTSAFGPFTPPIEVYTFDSGPSGTFQIVYEPAFIEPLIVHRYTVQSPRAVFNTRRKKVVCAAATSAPAFAFPPAQD